MINWIKKNKWFVLIAGLFAFFIFIYYRGKAAGKTIPLPDNGTGIPSGWTPEGTIQLIVNNFGVFDLTTNERKIIEILSALSPDQRAALKNEWFREFGNTIEEDLNSHFSDPDNLAVALNYFNFLQ